MENLDRPTTRPSSGGVPGLARVGFVRVVVGDGGGVPSCQVVGTTGRHLAVRPVSIRVATALMAQGVPSVVRHLPVYRPAPVKT